MQDVRAPGTTRRRFIRTGAAIAATSVLGASGLLRWSPRSEAATLDIELFVNEGYKPMRGGEQLYHWGYSTSATGISSPGNVITAVEGDTVKLRLTNRLDEPHSFAIAGVADTGPVAPGATRSISFPAPRAGTYLYRDALNAPMNRILGLHGALVVRAPGEPRDYVREYIWVLHATDRSWAERARLGQPIDPASFQPDYFTINGRFGDFSAQAKDTAPHGRLGEPALVRMVNSGAPVKSIHFHGQHPIVRSRSLTQRETVGAAKDTFFMAAEEVVEVIVPFEDPGDAYPVPAPGPGERDLKYPVHDHQELTQTLGGGLYPNGMLTDVVIEQ